MTDDDKDLDELFAPLRKSARDPVDHPTPEELDAYHAKELSPGDEERIREHIATCRECADLVLELQAFYDAGRKEPSDVADLEQVAAWRDLRENLPFLPEPVGKPVKAERGRPGFWAPLRSYQGIAAVLMVVMVSGFLVYRLQEPAKIQTVTLDPIGSVRRGDPVAIETVPPSADLVLRGIEESFTQYRAEIRKGGRVVETLPDLRKDNPSEVLLEEPGASLEPGDYEIVLWGVLNGREEEIARYEVRFVAP